MNPVLAENRKARHDYQIIDSFEAGIELKGSEVKSCRQKNISLNDAFAKFADGNIILYNCNIAKYKFAAHENYDPVRPRKLLLHKSEIRKIAQAIKEKGLTLIPMKFYLKKGFVKVDLALAKGRTQYDKREKLKREEDAKAIKRAMSAKKNKKI